MTLKELLGEELYKQVQDKIDEVNSNEPDKVKHVRYADLSEGGYVSKDKYDTKVTELAGIKKQLDEANAAIKSYQDMDVDGIKQSAKEWEDKYKADTKALKEQMEAQERSHQTDMFLSGYKYSSKAAETGIRLEFEKQGFKLKDGIFQGASEYMNALMEQDDFKGAFVIETKDDSQGGDTSVNVSGKGGMDTQMLLPQFASSTNGGVVNGSGNQIAGGDSPINFGFQHIVEPPKSK